MQTSEHSSCNISAVGKSGNSDKRYWCSRHCADATLKNGKRSPACRNAHLPEPTKQRTCTVDIDRYPGGVGIWGAVPPVYDTTTRPIDRGIHVHARQVLNGDKAIDRTYQRVKVRRNGTTIEINEVDAIHFMATTILGVQPEVVLCSRCGRPHLDEDWFSIHPHRRHLCAGCGHYFTGNRRATGNPAMLAAALLQQQQARPQRKAKRTVRISQRDFPGGICVWGSNPAIIWTSLEPERIGIHLHAFERAGGKPDPDETYASVVIDGVALDADAVRLYMAQTALPHVFSRVVHAECSECGEHAFDRGVDAYTPAANRACGNCGAHLRSSNLRRKTIANPFVQTLDLLARTAVRPPRRADLGLPLEAPTLGQLRNVGSTRANDVGRQPADALNRGHRASAS